MSNPGYIALSRMVVDQRAMDVRANNIANAGTPGFKGESVLFSDYLVQQRGVTPVSGGRPMHMVQDRATWRDFSQGPMNKTGNPLDVALQGEGFFAVDTPRGERYTRAGRFSLSAGGEIVDVGGNPVLGTDGRSVSVPPGIGNITITADGVVSSEAGQIGKLRVVQFDDQQAMLAEGNSLFFTKETPRDATNFAVSQGMVEGANIQAISQMTAMMAGIGSYKSASEFLDREAEREQSAIDRIGRGKG